MDSCGQNATNWIAGGSAKMWSEDDNDPGVNTMDHSFARFAVSDHADVHLGNVNRVTGKLSSIGSSHHWDAVASFAILSPCIVLHTLPSQVSSK